MNQKNEILADFEQIETEAVQTARMLTAYYKELRQTLHRELAEKLTVDFANQWWISMLGLHEQHVFMHDNPDGEA